MDPQGAVGGVADDLLPDGPQRPNARRQNRGLRNQQPHADQENHSNRKRNPRVKPVAQ